MVFVKHNSLKSDIFFNPIFIPGFPGSRFFRVQVFQGPGFLGSGPRVQGTGSGSRVRVQVLEVATESPLKMIKNVFFYLKLFFLLRFISEFITSKPGKQTIAIYILPNISGRKGKQIMKFGQLVEYNMTDICLKKSYTKCSGETIPRLFFKKSKYIIQFVLIVCQLEGYRNKLKLNCRALAFTLYKAFFSMLNINTFTMDVILKVK